MKFLGGDTIKDIATKVKQVTGGDFTPSQENAIKVANAFGFDKMTGANANNPQVAEGLAGNWQGKLLQMLHLAGMIGGLAHGYFKGAIGNPLIGVGIILLIVSGTFWSSDRGMVGAMGKHGNKGFETDKGPTTL
jgi:hypothetical protein